MSDFIEEIQCELLHTDVVIGQFEREPASSSDDESIALLKNANLARQQLKELFRDLLEKKSIDEDEFFLARNDLTGLRNKIVAMMA